MSAMYLPEIANESPIDFVKKLLQPDVCCFTGYDELNERDQSLVADVVMTLRFQPIDARNRVWMVPSRSPLSFADRNIFLPDLTSDPTTRANMCRSLLDAFPLDIDCPVLDVFIESTEKLSLGNLVAIISHAKALALASAEALSCVHLNQAFRSLCLPVAPVSVSTSSNHICAFAMKFATDEPVHSFIGLSEEDRCKLIDFRKAKGKLLLISGPIGAGKSHLAALVARNATKPAVRVTSADILRAKIGETEKLLHSTLEKNERVIIEDIDKLVPEDASESTGSVQRCLPVFLSFLNRAFHDEFSSRTIVATCRDPVNRLLSGKLIHIKLTNKLSFNQKVQLIKSQFPEFDEKAVTQFDLIALSNRSECVQFGQDKKMRLLRQAIAGAVAAQKSLDLS